MSQTRMQQKGGGMGGLFVEGFDFGLTEILSGWGGTNWGGGKGGRRGKDRGREGEEGSAGGRRGKEGSEGCTASDSCILVGRRRWRRSLVETLLNRRLG